MPSPPAPTIGGLSLGEVGRSTGQSYTNMWGESRYRDTGCKYSPKCTECPLPACKYERTGRPPIEYDPRFPEFQSLRKQKVLLRDIAQQIGITPRQADSWAVRAKRMAKEGGNV